MSKRYLTVMVIPHNEDQVRELQVSRSLLWSLIGALGLSTFALVYYAVGYYVGLGNETQYARLKTENTELQNQFESLQTKLKGLRGQVDNLADLDRKMRAWASFSEPGEDVRRVGVGGVIRGLAPWEGRVDAEAAGAVLTAQTSIDQLIREARFLKASFDSIAGHLSRDDRIRRHTPSIQPLPADAEWWISSSFGRRIDPFTGRLQPHYAVDIAGREGTPILATADGAVQRAGYHARLGHFLKLDHGSGVFTRYGHLQAATKLRLGEEIHRGQQIGRMGSSGRTTAPHLHYEVHVKDRAMNPMRYMLDAGGAGSVY